MSNISFFKKRIVQYIDYKGINKATFYKDTGIARSTLDKKTGLSEENVTKFFATYPDTNPQWFLTGIGDMLKNSSDNNSSITIAKSSKNSESIPLLPLEAFAGIGSDTEGVSFNTIEERYVIPLFKDIQVDFMVSVRGSSMYPKYSSGDVVACRLIKEQLYIQWNKVYVIDTISQGVIMKRLKKSENAKTYICKSDNKDYEPFEIPKKDIRNIALVTGVIRLE